MAKETLLSGYGFEFGGTSREEASSGTSIMLIPIICTLFVYIILCYLYSSLFIPLAAMLTIPFGLAGRSLFARIFGVENNIYLQTGFIMLIGFYIAPRNHRNRLQRIPLSAAQELFYRA